jgi:hypothetical protein
MAANRRKRPELTRAAPTRRFANIFGQTQRGAPDATPPSEPSNDAAARGADLGYQVIEEYMRQGQAFARAAWAPYLPQGRREGTDPRALTERMVQYASDLASVWVQYVQVMTSQGPTAGASKPSPQHSTPGAGLGAFDVGGEAQAPPKPSGSTESPVAQPVARDGASVDASPIRLSLEIASKRPAKVNVDLRRPIASTSPRAYDLRARDATIPRIAEVSIEIGSSAEDVLVRIVIPDDQPAATYSGLVVDETTNLPLGTLTVQIVE